MARSLRVFFHDACFDGTAASAVFASFYRDCIDRDVALATTGMTHRDGDPFVNIVFDADDHACLDFRFCPHPAMRWWYDHHATAFQPPTLRGVFDANAAGHAQTWAFDDQAPSCTGLLAQALARDYGWRPPAHLAELIAWADTIDAAAFASAEEACSLATPAQQLAAYVAHDRTPDEMHHYITQLATRDLSAIARDAAIANVVTNLSSTRTAQRHALHRLAETRGHVVIFNLLEAPNARSPGFLGYALFPQCAYTLAAVRSATNIKISVGKNPWGPPSRPLDVGTLCQAHGGGGHAVVGGITLQAHELPRALRTLEALATALT